MKAKEQLKMRAARSSKNVGELEVLVESLKRVIEKLKTENEALSKENKKVLGQGERIASEKALRQKINNLEQLVQSYEMKEVNLEEERRTIKKLIAANKTLRDDYQRETERYQLLEDKYKDVLMQFNMVSKENTRNE